MLMDIQSIPKLTGLHTHCLVFFFEYPPVIKHGLLENPPFTDEFSIKTKFTRDPPASHV